MSDLDYGSDSGSESSYSSGGAHGDGPQDEQDSPSIADIPPEAEDLDGDEEPKVLLCSKHGNNLVPTTCKACKACTRMVRTDMVKQLVVDHELELAVPTATQRLLRRRSDREEPTLTFTEEEMNVARMLHTQGVFKRGHFNDITRKYLYLSPEQNKLLCRDLETEQLFRPYEDDPKYSSIFKFKSKVVAVLKGLRVASRPLVLAITGATTLARHTRASGEGFDSSPRLLHPD